MRRGWRRVRKVRYVAVAMVLGLLAPPAWVHAQGEEASTAPEAHTYVVAMDDLFIAVNVVETSQAPDALRGFTVYLCDGEDVSLWVSHETTSRNATLEVGDARVDLLLGEAGVEGTVALAGGETREFTAELALGGAGLYRATATLDGTDYVGGWIVLNDGRQRGAVTAGGEVAFNPRLDLATGEATTSAGTLTPERAPCYCEILTVCCVL